MFFGNPDTFALEIGSVESFAETSGLFVQFRFWICKLPIGDWDDRIPLVASIENALTICATEENRRELIFEAVPPSEVLQRVYDAFFRYDYATNAILVPNLRDRFHLDDIGMGSIQDKYGLVLVVSSESTERIIAKDLKQARVIADINVPFGFVESCLNAYIEWGRSQLQAITR